MQVYKDEQLLQKVTSPYMEELQEINKKSKNLMKAGLSLSIIGALAASIEINVYIN